MVKGRKLDVILQILKNRIKGLNAIYIFGSRSSGRIHNASDYDFAILGDDLIDPNELEEIRVACEIGISKNVDLVDLRRVNLVLNHQILGEGKLVYQNLGASEAVAFFEATSMSRYCNLNEERREILNSIKMRGKIHA